MKNPGKVIFLILFTLSIFANAFLFIEISYGGNTQSSVQDFGLVDNKEEMSEDETMKVGENWLQNPELAYVDVEDGEFLSMIFSNRGYMVIQGELVDSESNLSIDDTFSKDIFAGGRLLIENEDIELSLMPAYQPDGVPFIEGLVDTSAKNPNGETAIKKFQDETNVWRYIDADQLFTKSQCEQLPNYDSEIHSSDNYTCGIITVHDFHISCTGSEDACDEQVAKIREGGFVPVSTPVLKKLFEKRNAS